VCVCALFQWTRKSVLLIETQRRNLLTVDFTTTNDRQYINLIAYHTLCCHCFLILCAYHYYYDYCHYDDDHYYYYYYHNSLLLH